VCVCVCVCVSGDARPCSNSEGLLCVTQFVRLKFGFFVFL